MSRTASSLIRMDVILIFCLSLYSSSCFAQKSLPLDNSTCNPQDTLNCLWNDHAGCFIRASRHALNGTCAPVDSSGRAGVQEVSPDGTQVQTHRCTKSVKVNALCDTIVPPPEPIETVTVNLNPSPTGSTPPPCGPPPPDEQFTSNGGNDSPDCEPLILDLEGSGFHLTNTANGVVFDIRADHHPLRILALAVYDQPETGGNGDGVIDERDAVYSLLRIWIDENHDGICQPNELHPLPELGVYSISLNYRFSRRTDEFGNVFRYRSTVNQHQSRESEVGKKIYDVFFVNR